jgi:hypothetical protein
VSIVRIGAKALRNRNFARTGERSDPIVARYLATGVSFDRIVAIYVATGAISGAIGVTRDIDTRKRGKGKQGKRVKGEEGKRNTGSLLPFSSVSQLSFFIRDPVELDEWRHRSNRHSFDHFQATGEAGLVVDFGLSFSVVPNLAIRTLTVPAEIPVRNRFQRKELKTTEQSILLGHFYLLAQHLYTYKAIIGVKQVVIYWWLQRFAGLLAHGAKV